MKTLSHGETAAGPAPAAAVPVEAPPGRAPGLIGQIVEAARAPAAAPGRRLEAFLAAPSPQAALRAWLEWSGRPGLARDKDLLARALNRDVARLDALINRQVNAVLHHPRFQKLEASWRGLRYLVEQKGDAENVKVRVLSVSWQELARDAERAIEFDQSQLFRKVYGEEFDTPGGEPYSVLLGDYEVRHRPSAEHPVDDLAVLSAVSQVAAAAFAPFVAGVHPAMFGLDGFDGLQQPLDLPKIFDQLEYLKWRAFRESEEARFVGLTLPRVLMRLPYEDDGSRTDRFRFHEDTSGPDRSGYLWGNAAYAFGAVLVRAFAESGWLADIRGVRAGEPGGGAAPGLPVHHAVTDKRGIAPKGSTDLVVTDRQEPGLSDLGFIPLCRAKDTDFSVFYGNQSAQKPKKYDDPAATLNARISTMLQYMLCASRMAHYVKVLARDKVGSFTGADECETFLHRWLQTYVTADSDASPEVKAKYPLREANVKVRDHPGRPGSYLCVMHLWPHFQLDELKTTVKLTTELAPGKTG